MNFFSVSGLTGALGGGNQSSPPPGTANESGGSENGTTSETQGAGSNGTSASANETPPVQTVAQPKPSNATPSEAAASTAEKADVRVFDRASLDAPVDGAARASAEQAVTKLFFDSLLSSISSSPDVAEIGVQNAPELDEQPAETKQDASDARIATDRFLEGLKLVNETA